jgi:RNA polymerase sigma-70 factor (ECF subfamily)
MADTTGRGDAAADTRASLLARARANDAEAWRRLVDLYRPLVVFWCGREGVRPSDAEDVAQDVFAAAAAGLVGFRRDRPGDTFRGWLRGITRNQALMHFRRSGRQPAGEGGSDALLRLQGVPDPQNDCDVKEEAEAGQVYGRALQLIRAEFAERVWQAFWLTAIDGRAPAALTVELGMSTASIRQAKSRVLRRLKQEVGDLLG